MDKESQSPSPYCANGCGFFANIPSNLCSKCSRTTIQKQSPTPTKMEVVPTLIEKPAENVEQKTEIPEVAPTESQAVQTDLTKCFGCKRKVGLLGFKCKCNFVFCSKHRFPDQHVCNFDFKAHDKAKLEEQNPQIVKPKLDKI